MSSFYLFFLFRFLLKDDLVSALLLPDYSACSVDACLWCLLVLTLGPCAGFGFEPVLRSEFGFKVSACVLGSEFGFGVGAC